ncbi:MAG: hypothetical protein COB90_02055 [Hyphomicrobiales bacterium]|nr:MAG: hypothetical protein COB90_02055 [Hyphomicrobiales bacterium]
MSALSVQSLDIKSLFSRFSGGPAAPAADRQEQGPLANPLDEHRPGRVERALEQRRNDEEVLKLLSEYVEAGKSREQGRQRPFAPHQLKPGETGPQKTGHHQPGFRLEGFSADVSSISGEGFSYTQAKIQTYSVGPEGISFQELTFERGSFETENGVKIEYARITATEAYTTTGRSKQLPAPGLLANFSA